MLEIILGGAMVAALLGFLAAWVLAARPGEALNRALFAYLTLTAGVLLVFAVARADPGRTFASPLTASRLILWFDLPQFILIPFVLDELFLAKPRTAARRAVLGGLALAVAGMLAALALLPALYWQLEPGDPATPRGHSLQQVYVLANDAVHALAALLAGYVATRPDRTPLQRRQAALVGAGFACLALHATAAVAGSVPLELAGLDLGAFALRDPGAYAGLLGLLALPALPWVVAPFAGTARRGVLAALALATVLGATQGAASWLAAQPALQGFELIARGGRLVALAELALFLAVAVFRFSAAGVTVDARARLATATGVVLAGALAAGPALAALAGLGPSPPAAVALVAGLAAALALPRRTLREVSARVTDRLLLAPDDPGVTRERARIYAAALRTAAAERGGSPPPGDPALAELRGRLGLGVRDHELLASALDTRAVTLAPETLFLERYRIVRELGRGGFGEAFLARDEWEDRDVVLKRLLGDRGRDAEALRRFQRELRLAATVAHPNIVAVHGTEAGPDGAYLVMEHLAGGSLADRLRRTGPMTGAEAAAMARDVLAGLAALHERGIVHRDVKPGNILFDAAGRAKLGDFTIAREVVSGETEGPGGVPLGTLAYVAPEQGRGKGATARSDLYSLGASVYEALAGRPPRDFTGLTDYEAAMRVASGAPDLPLPGVSGAWNAWLARALARDPAERPADARAMAAALPPAPEGVSRGGTPAGSGPRRRRRPG